LVELTKKLENSETSAVDFVEDFKMNLYSKEIYVLHQRRYQILTKRGDFSGFCFSIEIGIKTHGTCVNGKLVPLNYELKKW
jgi:GTP pyrophosphokinase